MRTLRAHARGPPLHAVARHARHVPLCAQKMLRTFKQVANADAWWMERELDEMESGLGFVAGIVSGLHTSVVRSNNPHAP